MPEFQPSCFKPRDTPHLKNRHGMSQEQKAKQYDKMRPGVAIEEGHKAERFDRMAFRAENGAINLRERRGRRSGSSIMVPELPWLRNDD